LLNCKPSIGLLALEDVKACRNFPFDSSILFSLLVMCFLLLA
jgi:hypothetical protein